MDFPNWRRSFSRILRFGFFLLCAPLWAGAEILDQEKVHADYNNGDFDQVQQELEAFKSRNESYSLEDSVFIAKHLAVVYAADPQTREKGRYYMFRLLELLPTAKIVDMFVSEEIDRIFERVREEFTARQRASGKAPSAAKQPLQGSMTAKTPDGKPPFGKTPSKEGKSSSTVYWIAGSVGVLAIGAAATYFLMPQGQEPEDKVYVVRK